MDTQALQGYWWLPEASEEDHVAGTLHIEHGRLPRLNLIGSLEDDPHILTLRTEPLILGVLDTGRKVTLIEALGSTGLRQHDWSVYSEDWTAQGAILGEHFEDPEDSLAFSDIDIEIDMLTHLTSSGLARTTAGEDLYEWTWERPLEISASPSDVTVSLQVLPHGGFVNESTGELRFWAVPRMRVHSETPLMLAKILDEVIYPLVDLTSLFADCPASIERIHLHRPGEPPAAGRFSKTAFELIVSPSRRPSELCTQPIRLAAFDADFPFGDVCGNWMQVWADADVRILLDRFFTQSARPSPFPEVTFLGLAVFLEGFHKATVQRGERRYLNRLEELLSVVNELLRATETDGVVLAETIRDTRNTLAHGRRTEGDRTVDGFALQSLNGVADLIVRGLILTQLDFTSDEVADLLRLKCAKIHGQNVGMPWHSST